VARAIGQLILSQAIYIPYAIYVDGQVIRLYDSVNHQLAEEEAATEATSKTSAKRDLRWIRIRRPFVVAGAN